MSTDNKESRPDFPLNLILFPNDDVGEGELDENIGPTFDRNKEKRSEPEME